jgi:minor curlin subunit
MKKLSTLLVAFLFTTGMAFAQDNDATTNQDGDNLEATIEQVGGAHNVATQDQFGLNNILGIYQSGNHNVATQTQDSRETGSYDPDNEAYIDQSGDWNEATQNQDTGSQRNFADIDQSGDWNEATQSQYGQGFDAIVDQSGDHNYAIQTQDGNAFSAEILQSGSHNWASQTQDGQRNIAEIEQSGDHNEATQEQFGSQSHPLDGELNILQTGNFNVAFQYQDNTETGSFATTYQSGSNNFAEQNQVGPGDNYASIEQLSDWNTAVQNQTGSENNAVIVQD